MRRNFEMASVNGDTYDNSALPEDLWIDIFIRLSVKSLLRVKCVCKHWHGLIKAHNFEYKYLKYQKTMKQNRLLLRYFENLEVNYTILDDDVQSSNTYDSPEYLKAPNNFVDLDGSVNGLYCLYNIYGRCVLWNPALMEFKIVPLPPPHILPHYKIRNVHVGFGAGSLINDHKIVLVSYFMNLCKDHDTVYNELVVNLYNLSTNTWRPFDRGDFPLLYPENSFITACGGSFVNGTYHWWVSSGVVLAFDMGNETFRMIPGPDFSQYDPESYYSYDIAVYEEHIALLRSDLGVDYYSLDIWVMLEEGIWFKQFMIGPCVEPMHPLEFWRKDRLLLLTYTRMVGYTGMVSCDVITQEIRNVVPLGDDTFVQAYVYYESLVSLNSGNECDIHMVSDFLNRRSF